MKPMSNLENNEKILKIFSNIRCLNRDQLPRYLDGRLTDVEKHLVEQHLVDCNLCFDALQVLQQQQYREKYQPLATSMQQYIRNGIKRISQVHKVERYQRQEQKKESFLIYFWVVAAIAIGAGVVYLVQQQGKFKSPVSKAIASTADLPPTQSGNPPVQAAVVTPVHAETEADPALKTAPPPAAALAAPPATTPKPVVTKDSLKANVTPPLTVAAPLVKDSAKKLPPPPPKPVEARETTRVAAAHKDTPAVVKKTEEKPAPVKKEKEKEATPEKKPATEASGTDEFLYKAAQVYHHQGDLDEAISRYKHLAESPGRYGELSRYQLAVCYRSKGQTGKARRMFKEVVRMNGSMKDKAQAALDNL
jgi:tetratricopeptide (TPR) repeat protein